MAWGDLGLSTGGLTSAGQNGLEVAANATVAAPADTKTTVVSHTAVGDEYISLIVGTSTRYGRWFLTIDASDDDERTTGPSKTVEFGFGKGLFKLTNGQVMQLRYKSPDNTNTSATVNGTIYRAV